MGKKKELKANKEKWYDHTLSLELADSTGRIKLIGLMDIKNGQYVLSKDHVWLDIDNRTIADNPDWLPDTVLPMLNLWKRTKTEIGDCRDYREVMQAIPKEHRKAVRRLIKDGIQKGFFKEQP